MTLNINAIVKAGLTIKTFLDLKYLYHKIKGGEELFVLNYGKLLFDDLYSYQKKGYIKIKHEDTNVEFELRNKLCDLFEGEKDYFYTFVVTFPIKTPSGRYLSVKKHDTIAGKELRKKWDKRFKNDAVAARKAIEVLEAEMAWRRKTGKFEFMHNAETWLNQCDFEKYEYLLDEKVTITERSKEDFS